ncbi:hypothetical protein QR680_009509 [Steinernema hermaphroditum]|uniref:Uncharacterized protein n=1 Tax=Steinernema hermaphroditum TaxID=289476 RepID=A0AA39IN05_9BILA|nr:hypothetical protein QR680_009509 [Steinernema hermaphroditum]
MSKWNRLGIPKSPNSAISAFFTSGSSAITESTHNNGLNFIARAHEAVQQGCEWRHNGHVVTIFSASNYCNSHNEAAFMIFHNLVPFFHNFVSS